MKKLIAVFLTLTLIFALGGCGKTEQECLRVYSFSGENELFSVSNGVIVLDETEEIFCGGDLNATGDLFSDIVSCSTTFFVMEGNERKLLLSNSVVDMTGGSVSFNGDLGQISGEGVFTESITDNTRDWENNLYFELTTTDKDGAEQVYQLKLSLTEVTEVTTDAEKQTDN